MIRTGITYKKIPCYMRDLSYRWFIVKKVKIFWSYVIHFWILTGVRKCRILIGLWKWAFLNCPRLIGRKNEVSASFFFLLLRFLMKKKLLFKSVTVLTIAISLYFNETKKNLFDLHCSCETLMSHQVRRI